MFNELLKEKTQFANDIIDKYLPECEDYQKIIVEAMRYSVEAGGKRIRPILMLETYNLFNGSSESIYPFMAAMEFVHTYSLVHDDLPSMDNDDYRRGKLTTHKKYGEAIAVLAGDGLLNYAFETAAKSFVMSQGDINAEKAIIYFANSSGIFGMVGGQTVDIETDRDGQITRDKLDFIYKLKTGALLKASMHIGAIIANASEDDIKIIDKIADNIGLAFQIQDDILDETSTLEELGKPVGSDEKNNKATYVTFEGLNKSKKDVRRLTEEALALLDSLENRNDFLRELLIYLIDRKN